MARRLYDPAPVVARIRLLARVNGLSVTAYVLSHHGPSVERQFCRWQAGGRLQLGSADEIALALGVHPVELWGDAWTAEAA